MALLSTLLAPGTVLTTTSVHVVTNKTLSTNSIWNGTTIGAAYGGTGLTSPGVAGNVLTSNGTSWTSSLPASPVVVDEITNLFNARNTIFTLYSNGVALALNQPQDVQVVIDGKILTPDTKNNQVTYPWSVIGSFGTIGGAYKISNNKLVLYNAPKSGQTAYLLYKQTSTAVQTPSRYPFTATTVALGD